MRQLRTRFSERMNKEHVLQEYPRPFLERDSYYNLNGIWQYAIVQDDVKPVEYDGDILVPFSPECSLSGVNRKVLPTDVLWYKRELPEISIGDGEKLLLHFGAVDQHAWVYIDGELIGEHHGGYLPFTCDITKSMCSREKHELLVKVVDKTDTSYHARGKQKLKPGGMFYTAQSGIWQTVWMEKAPKNYIQHLTIREDFDQSHVRIKVFTEHRTEVNYTIHEAKIHGTASTNEGFTVLLPDFHPWSPENPFLYHVTFETKDDRVTSYFAMRKCDVQKDEKGIPRLFLNNHPYFQTGVLDQGYFPESLYTPPSDEALVQDILSMKELGFNMLRKHVKIEPERFYWHCDRLGILVWQDMVNGGSHYQSWFVTYLATLLNRFHIGVSDRHHCLLSRRKREGRREFFNETRETVRMLRHHPCIVVWVPFNEGWGQFSTLKICEAIRKIDPTRLVDHASGWYDQGGGDIQSLHYYFFQFDFTHDRRRAMALTEYGGYSYSLPGHCACDKVYGYRKYANREELSEGFRQLIENTVIPAAKDGLSAAIYTQLSDIEEETNGIYTYDREICKLDEKLVQECNDRLKKAKK